MVGRAWPAWVAVVGLAVAACASQVPGGGGGGGAAGGSGPVLDVVWQPCTTKATGLNAACAQIEVPARWPNSARTVTLFVKRLRPTNADEEVTQRDQLWLLQGGPGFGGVGLEEVAKALTAWVGDVDVFVPDHRGTGQSQQLECPQQQDPGSPGGWEVTAEEAAACVQALAGEWGQDLQGFSAEQAATDVGKLIAAQPHGKVWVYGISYGTAWALHYLRLFPNQANAVVLDSPCPPGVCRLDDYDKQHDDVAHALFDRCGQDPYCSGKLGLAPWSKLAALYGKLDAGHCAKAVKSGWTPKNIKRLFASFVRAESLRIYMMPLVLQLDRCTADDEKELAKVPLNKALAEGDKPATKEMAAQLGYSQLLHDRILATEFWSGTPVATLQAQFAQLLVAPGAGVEFAAIAPAWGNAKAPQPAWPVSQVPVLVLSGGLDPQTPAHFAQAAMAGMTHVATRWLVQVPDSAHGLIATSGPGYTCTGSLVAAFLKSPTTAPDLACVAAWPKLKFQGGAAGEWGAAPAQGDPLEADPESFWPQVQDELARARVRPY